MVRLALVLLISFLSISASASQVEKMDNEQVRKLPAQAETVVMNFWATWCVPCVEEIPIFTKIQKQFKDIVVIGISMDDPDRENLVQKFVQDHPMGYRVAFWTGDNFEEMVDSISPKWNGPIPATFVFKKGKLIYSKVGQITESELMKIL
jgi:AhpC/TSA family.